MCENFGRIHVESNAQHADLSTPFYVICNFLITRLSRRNDERTGNRDSERTTDDVVRIADAERVSG